VTTLRGFSGQGQVAEKDAVSAAVATTDGAVQRGRRASVGANSASNPGRA
jgi:hypothetical protein